MHLCELFNWRQFIRRETGYRAGDITSERGDYMLQVLVNVHMFLILLTPSGLFSMVTWLDDDDDDEENKKFIDNWIEKY